MRLEDGDGLSNATLVICRGRRENGARKSRLFGLVGSWLVPALASQGARVVAVRRDFRPAAPEPPGDGVAVVHGDILN